MRHEAKYGAPPVDLGLVDLSPTEMMFWLYCPIKAPGGDLVVPPNLSQFRPLISRAAQAISTARWVESYVYLTAKTLWVTNENPGGRPGWHSDGFMTDDINLVWSDSRGTLFWEPNSLTCFTQHHDHSLTEMAVAAESGPVRSYPDKHLLLMDERVIHRIADFDRPGMRSFVKISISRHQYRLAGNSINHGLSLDWAYQARRNERNAPEVPDHA